MKRFALVVLVVMACGFSVYGQTAKVRVFPFEAKNGISAGDAAAVTELFTAELIKTGKIQVDNPSNYHVLGTMTQFAGELVITVKMINWQTQISASTFSRMNSMEQVLGRLPGIAKSLVEQLSSTKNAIRQDYIVKINPFDLKGEMSAGDLEGITEFITYSLVNSGIKVVWSRGNENVNASLRGSVVSLAGQTVITASIVDNSTNQPVSTATLQLGNIGEIYDSKNKSNTSSKWNSFTTALLNVPARAGASPLIGKWRGTNTTFISGHKDKYYMNIDIDVRADGTIVVERYEALYAYYKTNAFLDLFDEWKFDREERVAKTGTGTYSSQGIRTIVKLNIPGLPYRSGNSTRGQIDFANQEEEVGWNNDFSEFSLRLYNKVVFLNGSCNGGDSSSYKFKRR